MLIPIALIATIVVLLIGGLILWSNPQRPVNRVVFTCSLNWAAWLLCLHIASYLHAGVFWLRMACSVGAWLPMHFWIVNETIAKGGVIGDSRQIRWFLGWLFVSLIGAGMCFSESFIPYTSTSAHPIVGFGYYSYITLYFSLHIFVLYCTFRNLKSLTGGAKIELRIWLFGGCAMTLALLATMALNAFTKNILYIRLQPLFVLAFYGSAAYTITTYRIFDAGYILRTVSNKIILIASVAGVGFAIQSILVRYIPPLFAAFCGISIALIVEPLLRTWLDRWFQFYSQATKVRQAAYIVAQSESRFEKLESAFLSLLKGWSHAEHAVIIIGDGDRADRIGQEVADEDRLAHAMRRLEWVTPERLIRERATPDREALRQFLVQHSLGVAVFTETPMMNVIVGLGVPPSRLPYIYPQVQQLQELAVIIEGAFEKGLMASQIQHAEQLATVGLLGASMAHEIRNPLVSIKAIVQLLPNHYQDSKFREKFFRLIGDEVVRIDRMTEQLLDLASPKVYSARPVKLHPTVETAVKLVEPRAMDKRVEIRTDFRAEPDRVHTDPAAVTQVLLNLCINAIQAMEARPNDRWLNISTQNTPGGVEIAISDNGPGFTLEMRKRLFRPFHTTKSSGFGLGLTICRDILSSLSARIALDPAIAGRGATFRVTFPCPP